jgi:hypothetical protein
LGVNQDKGKNVFDLGGGWPLSGRFYISTQGHIRLTASLYAKNMLFNLFYGERYISVPVSSLVEVTRKEFVVVVSALLLSIFLERLGNNAYSKHLKTLILDR